MLVKKSAYEKAGGLDEKNLPVAFNDIDFCLRLREQGYRIVWTPYAKLLHHESLSRGPENTPEKQVRAAREIAFMRKRWGKILDCDPHYNPNLSLQSEQFALAEIPRIKNQDGTKTKKKEPA